MTLIRKSLQLSLSIAMVLACFCFIERKEIKAEDIDFDNDYDYYYSLCTNTSNTLDSDQKEACKLFRTYNTEKQKEKEDILNEVQSNIEKLKADIANQGQVITKLQLQIDDLIKQINIINDNILTLENKIETLQKQINERQQNIENIDNGIRQRMVATQSNVVLNSYIKFIMGADSFIDILRRISAVNEITSYDQAMMAKLEEEKALLKKDQDELQLQKDDLVIQQNNLESQKKLNEQLAKAANELIVEYQMKEQEFEQKMDEIEQDLSYLNDVLTNIDIVVDELYPSEGFYSPVKKAWFYISSACYYYEKTYGSFHAAIDIGINRGVALYAAANGIVIDAADGCPVNGYYGSTCNSGRGNYVFILTRVENKYFAVYYYHMNSISVANGDKVYGGKTLLGYTGTSGNSTGPHLHYCIYYVGDAESSTYSSLIRQYQKYGLRWGMSYSISSACYVRGGKAPCMADPEKLYGWYYGKGWYYGNGDTVYKLADDWYKDGE